MKGGGITKESCGSCFPRGRPPAVSRRWGGSCRFSRASLMIRQFSTPARHAWSPLRFVAFPSRVATRCPFILIAERLRGEHWRRNRGRNALYDQAFDPAEGCATRGPATLDARRVPPVENLFAEFLDDYFMPVRPRGICRQQNLLKRVDVQAAERAAFDPNFLRVFVPWGLSAWWASWMPQLAHLMGGISSGPSEIRSGPHYRRIGAGLPLCETSKVRWLPARALARARCRTQAPVLRGPASYLKTGWIFFHWRLTGLWRPVWLALPAFFSLAQGRYPSIEARFAGIGWDLRYASTIAPRISRRNAARNSDVASRMSAVPTRSSV